jgi:TonB-dependent receptor
MQIDSPNMEQTEYLNYWLSLNFTDVPLRKVLDKISSMTGVDFSYSEKAVPVDTRISINVENVTLASALNEILANTNSSWVAMAGNHIVITERKNDELGSGNVKGKVYDAESKDPLPGATVLVKGTSIGASTDMNGDFVIHNVPAGDQTIVVSYIGYNPTTEVVNVPGDQTLTKDFYLTAVAIQGKTVVVTGQAQGQIQAINEQNASNTIINVVSADKIKQLPDASASAALSRLPGVSLMNGDQIVIRGLQAKDNVILVNGVQLPSTDQNTRSVDLGFFSSNMLSGIEVIKAVTPDMDANALGGVVNLRLMEAPTNFHVDVLTQGDYNSQAHTTDDYKLWGSVSDRFLDNKLGVFIQGNADRTDGGNDQTTAVYGVNTAHPNFQSTYEMNTFTWDQQAYITTNYGGSLIMDYVLPHGKIVLQNTLTRNLNDDIDYEYYSTLSGAAGALDLTADRNKYNRDLDINGLQAENDFGPVKADLTLSHSYSNQGTDIRYGDPGDNFGFENGSNNQPFLYANGTPVDMTLLTGADRATLTPDDMDKLQVNPAYADSSQLSGWATMRWNNFTQQFYNSALNFTVPAAFSSDVSATFKFGGKFARTTRVNELTEFYKRTGDADMWTAVQNFIPGTTLSTTNPLALYMIRNNDYKRGQYFLNGTYDMNYVMDIPQMDELLPGAATDWVNEPHTENSSRYNFNGAEIFTAAYLMGTFNIGPQLTILGGARFEHYNMNYHAHFVYVTHPVDGLADVFDTMSTTKALIDSLGVAKTNRNDDNLLPNAQLRYKITDWCDLRLAYTNTLVRPDYNAIMPNVLLEPGNYGEAGNPKLKPTNSKNYDAGLSFYNNEIGLLTLDGFYKHMDDVFYQTGNVYYQDLKYYNASFPDSAVWAALGITGTGAPSASTPIQTYLNNPFPAHVYGLELDWQTRFWYLPGPLSYLVFDVNYTHVWSNMDYQQVIDEDSTMVVTDPITGRRTTQYVFYTITTTRSARLLDQSNDVLNVSVGADYKGFSGRVSFNLQSNVITSVSASTPEEDQFTGNIYRWDIALRQQLPVEGLSLGFNVQNLSHQPIYTYQDFPRVDGGPILQNIEQTQYQPRYFELNLRYSL